jgi:hypothetical protein
MVKLKYFLSNPRTFSKMDSTPFIPSIPADPPVGFPTHLLSVFFLITAIFRNNVAFLVFFNERREWLMLDQILIDVVRGLQLQIPIDQIDWLQLCQYFLTNFRTLPFHLIQGIQEIEWCNVIFVKRNLLIRLEDGRQVPAKYIENFGEMWCEQSGRNEHHIRCQIRGTDEVVIIPISAIVNHILSKKDVSQYDENLAQQKAKEKAARDSEEAKKQSEDYKAQMRKRGEIVSYLQIQRNYPLFSEVSMKVLFLLCKWFGIALDFTYQFNLLVRRLVCLGDQSIYSSPQLAEEDQEAFMAFMEKYMNQIVGRVILSNTIRFQQSTLPDHLRGIFEIHCHRNQNYSPTQADVDSFLSKSDESFVKFAATISEKALALPNTFWTQAEFGVLTKQKKGSGMCQFLFPMPKEFPKDIFE